jgi:hypothetical protein
MTYWPLQILIVLSSVARRRPERFEQLLHRSRHEQEFGLTLQAADKCKDTSERDDTNDDVKSGHCVKVEAMYV